MIGIILDEHGDFALEKGHIALGDADLQSADSVIRANRGEFKEMPLVGGEVLKLQGGQPNRMWCVGVKKMLRGVGVHVASITMDADEIKIRL